MSASKFEPCPQDIKDAVARAYAEHTGETYEEVAAHNPVVGLVRGYMTDGVGFGGDLVVIIWPAVRYKVYPIMKLFSSTIPTPPSPFPKCCESCWMSISSPGRTPGILPRAPSPILITP